MASPTLAPRAALYARVSTQNNQDPMMQTRELEEYCKRRGWVIADQFIPTRGTKLTEDRDATRV